MLLTGGASLADKLEQNPNVVRCSYSTFTQWSGLLDMALQFNWTNFGIIFDDTDSARHIWATSLMTRMDTNKLTYVQSSLMALSDIPSILETVRKQARGECTGFIVLGNAGASDLDQSFSTVLVWYQKMATCKREW